MPEIAKHKIHFESKNNFHFGEWSHNYFFFFIFILIHLKKDIDCSSLENFIPIGNENEPFIGNFEGNGNKIKKMKMEWNDLYTGLFGYTSGASINNLTLENFNVTSTTSFVAFLVGRSVNSVISNIHLSTSDLQIDNLLLGTGNYYSHSIGSIFGSALNSTVKNCSVKNTLVKNLRFIFLFYFILFYFILFYFILFYFILFYFF